MSATGTQTGAPAGADYTKKDTDFNMDPSSKYAEWEQRGQGTVGANPHEGGEKPSGLDKAAGKLEEVTGKAMGDKELQARGLADQGKGTANKMQDLKTEAGGNVSYPDRV
ncbi:hypothetical protein JCM8115_006888 [Rhodotorula mucilaginosa]|uniref:CsbD-like domain-containing protein n=1 Tax=Rhodotorula mucilaginosa TaxID=5537 RepID=A0A9P6W4X8_RHOMI|nr:hypothetical protein C6P46_002122 [Rhodotorula mucilaginosa]